MKILITEYLQAASWEYPNATDSLIAEAREMLTSVACDFCRLFQTGFIENLTVAVCPSASLDLKTLSVISDSIVQLPATKSIDELTQTLYETYTKTSADTFLLIAPETGGILRKLVDEFRHKGCDMLAASKPLIELGEDKLRTFQFCQRHQLSTITTWHQTERNAAFTALPGCSTYVVKPIDGVGCDQIQRIHRRNLMNADLPSYSIIQPFLNGEDWSVGVIRSESDQTLLTPVQQQIRWQNNQPSYHGSQFVKSYQVPAPQQLSQLLQRTLDLLPDFRGYVGIDLLFADTWRIVEINPRLCTSYCVYRRQHDTNLARAFVANTPR